MYVSLWSWVVRVCSLYIVTIRPTYITNNMNSYFNIKYLIGVVWIRNKKRHQPVDAVYQAHQLIMTENCTVLLLDKGSFLIYITHESLQNVKWVMLASVNKWLNWLVGCCLWFCYKLNWPKKREKNTRKISTLRGQWNGRISFFFRAFSKGNQTIQVAGSCLAYLTFTMCHKHNRQKSLDPNIEMFIFRKNNASGFSEEISLTGYMSVDGDKNHQKN